jgi:hypothetical protein
MPPGRKGYRTEERFLATIEDSIPTDPPGVTWSNIWNQVKREVKSKETLARYLKKLIETGQVVKDGSKYRLNPILHYDYPEGIRIWLRSDAAKKKATQFEGKRFTKPETFRDLTGLLFNNIYRLYITMLNELVKIGGKAAAYELVYLFMRAEVMPVLSDYALDVWQNRSKINIVETLGGTTLEQLDMPPKGISPTPVDAFARFAKDSASTVIGRKISRRSMMRKRLGSHPPG